MLPLTAFAEIHDLFCLPSLSLDFRSIEHSNNIDAWAEHATDEPWFVVQVGCISACVFLGGLHVDLFNPAIYNGGLQSTVARVPVLHAFLQFTVIHFTVAKFCMP